MVDGANGPVGLPVQVMGYEVDNEYVIIHCPPMVDWIVVEMQLTKKVVIPILVLVR